MSRAVLRAGQAPPAPPALHSGVFHEIESFDAAKRVELSYEQTLAAIAEAQAQAERIRREANEEANRLRQEAIAEANEIRETAKNEGYAEGYAEGCARADREARSAIDAAVEVEANVLREGNELFCEALVAEQQRIWSEIEGQLKDLGMEIAERVLKAELTVNPDVVLQITQHAMRRLADKDHVRIRVNPEDVERVRDHRDEIMRLFEGLRSVDILEDRRVGIGGVQIETDTGMVDARIETQMQELTRALDV